MSPALALYLAVSAVATPLAHLALRRRAAAGKEHPDRLQERMGHASAARPEKPLVWLHAASVGEGLSLLPLVELLRERRPDVAVLVTSGTVTSAELLAERLPQGCLHQFVPLDIRAAVERFLANWRPDLAVWIESEIWPRLVWSAKRRGIPALLLNARLGQRSRARWRRAPGAARALFSTFDEVHAQDRETADFLQDIGIPPDRVDLVGTIKDAAPPLPCDPNELERLERSVAGRFVWVAASTHPGEEAFAVEAHRALLDRRGDALLLLVPRHPERGDGVAGLLDASDLRWSRRRDGLPAPDVSVYLADTLGELGLWYRLADAAFVGGSLGEVGGHNPYEPIALDTPVLHGPDTASFADVYRVLDAGGGARTCRTPEELAACLDALADGAVADQMTARARKTLGGGSGALAKALAAVLARLPRE